LGLSYFDQRKERRPQEEKRKTFGTTGEIPENGNHIARRRGERMSLHDQKDYGALSLRGPEEIRGSGGILSTV